MEASATRNTLFGEVTSKASQPVAALAPASTASGGHSSSHVACGSMPGNGPPSAPGHALADPTSDKNSTPSPRMTDASGCTAQSPGVAVAVGEGALDDGVGEGALDVGVGEGALDVGVGEDDVDVGEEDPLGALDPVVGTVLPPQPAAGTTIDRRAARRRARTTRRDPIAVEAASIVPVRQLRNARAGDRGDRFRRDPTVMARHTLAHRDLRAEGSGRCDGVY